MRLPKVMAAIGVGVLAFAVTASPAAADWNPSSEPTKLQVAHHRYVRHSPRYSAASSAHSQSGKASYYSNGAYGGAGHCAHKTIAKGTPVTVHGPHGTIVCTVTDRGPYVAGRIIDLAPHDFAVVAGGTGAGVVGVTISW